MQTHQRKSIRQTGTLLTVNSPDSIGHLYRFATRGPSEPKALPERVAAAALMREAGVKCGVFVGVPKVSPNSFEEVLLMRVFRVMSRVRL